MGLCRTVAPSFRLFPEILTLDRFDIRITAMDPAAEYWAMGSATENDSQRVVLIVPN
jgi:hypothetical protein